MSDKKELESNLLKVFYALEMDEIFKRSPETAEINYFEQWDDKNRVDHNWHFSKDKKTLLLQLWAADYEKGSHYLSGVFSFLAAWKSRTGFIFKGWIWVKMLAILLIVGFDLLGVFLMDFHPLYLLIPLICIGGVVFIFYYAESIRKSKIEIEYRNNLNKISNLFETKTLEKQYLAFFKLYTKTFLSSILLVLLAGLSVLGLIGNIFI